MCSVFFFLQSYHKLDRFKKIVSFQAKSKFRFKKSSWVNMPLNVNLDARDYFCKFFCWVVDWLLTKLSQKVVNWSRIKFDVWRHNFRGILLLNKPSFCKYQLKVVAFKSFKYTIPFQNNLYMRVQHPLEPASLGTHSMIINFNSSKIALTFLTLKSKL